MSGTLPKWGRLAAVDFGMVRMGIAICDVNQTIASPWDVYSRGDAHREAEYFRELVCQQEVVGWVVGLPVHMSGDESGMSRRARLFGQWLEQITELPVVFVDERFTTALAEQYLGAAGLSRNKRKRRRDKLAAQLLLQAYLDAPDDAIRPASGLDE